MSKKNNYPKERKPSKKVKCPHCPRHIAERGIVNHLKLSHHVAYIDIEKFLALSGLEDNPAQKNCEDQKSASKNEFEALKASLIIAYKQGSKSDIDQLIEKLEKELRLLGWSEIDIKNELERYRSEFKLPEEPRQLHMVNHKIASPTEFVVRMENNKVREIDHTDYKEVLKLAYYLDAVLDQYRERIRRELPIRLSIGSL